MAGTIIETQVQAINDNCYVAFNPSNNTWSINTTPSNVAAGYFVDNYAVRCGCGLRFQSVSVPRGAYITVAYMIYNVWEATYWGASTKITGNKEPNPAPFTTLSDYQARRGTIVGGPNNSRITSAQVDWIIPDGNAGGWWPSTLQRYNTPVQTPSIVDIIQELVNQPGWVSGNAMTFFWDDHDGRTLPGHQYQSIKEIVTPLTKDQHTGVSWAQNAAKLHIEYTFGSNTFTVPVIAVPIGQPCGLKLILASDSTGLNVAAESYVAFISSGLQHNIIFQLIAPAPGTYYIFVLGYMNGELVTVNEQGIVSIAE